MKKMNIEKLEEELRIAGFNVRLKETEVVKNGVLHNGIRIDSLASPDASPIVYYTESDTDETILERMVGALNQDFPKFDLGIFQDPDYFSSHVYLAVVKHSSEPDDVLVKRYLNLDIVMKLVVYGDITFSEFGSTKVNGFMLESLGIDEEQAWKMAGSNSYRTAHIAAIGDMLGLPAGAGPEMYIAMANHGHCGACAICFPDLFREFLNSSPFAGGVNSLLIIPSSTEEVILVPDNGDISSGDILEMVESINASIVEPELRLDPAVYRYSLEDNEISTIAVLGKGAMA